MSTLAISADTFVTLSYVLFDEKGEEVDRVTKAEPTTYVHGYAQIVPGLERQLAGVRAGERREFTVEPVEAFGDREDAAIFEIERGDFPEAEGVVAGDVLEAEGPDGEQIVMRVLEVRADAMVVDTNHPLAGQRVRFDVEVSDVRAATEDEIAEAQADLEDRLEADKACGCGHEHGDDHAHNHAHDHDHAHDDHAKGADLVQLSKKVLS